MRLEVLQEFAEIANRLNISSTADSVNVAQPALSKHMAELEKELGFKLFVRERKMRLTPAGKVYFATVSKILYAHRLAIEECRELHKKQVSDIRLFKPYVNDEGCKALMRATRNFTRENPKAPISFSNPRGRTPEECVATDRVDIAVTVLGGDHSRILKQARKDSVVITPFLTVDLHVWAAAGHLVHGLDTLTMRRLGNFGLMMPANHCFDSMKAAVHGVFESAGTHAPDDVTIIPADTIQEFFLRANENDVALVTAATAEDPALIMHDEMKLRRIDDEAAKLTFALVHREHNTNPNVIEFIDVFWQAAESLAR